MHREKGELVLDNPLFSPSEDSQEKCWDVNKETESGEIAMVFPVNTLKSSENASPESSRKVRGSSSRKRGNVVQSIVHNLFDEESQDMEEMRTRIRKFMEQEDEAACNESGHIPNPLIIQYGGVASYHPVYSPFAPRPRFLRFRGLAPATADTENKGKPIQNSPEMERREEEIKEYMPQAEHFSSGRDEDTIAAENGPELALNSGLDNKGNENITPPRVEPAAGHTEGLKMAANCLNLKDTGKTFRFRKRMPMFWTVSIFLVFSFSLSAVIPVGSANYTITQIRKTYAVATFEPAILKLRAFKEYFKRFQGPSVAAMKFIFQLGGPKESSRASLRRISDFGLLCFRSERFSYFRSVGGCLMMELYEKLKSISTRFIATFKAFCVDLVASMMNVAAELVPRFCKCLNSDRVVDTGPRNTGAEIHGTNVGKFGKPALRAPSNRLRHENFEQFFLSLIRGMDICPREDGMNTCPILWNQGIEHGRDHDDLYDGVDLSQEQANSTHAETHNSQKFDQILPEDQENRLWAANENSEIFVSSPEQTEIQQINLEDLYINGTSEAGPIIEKRPHEFWFLIWASLLVAASLVAIVLLILRGLIPRRKLPSTRPYSSQKSKKMVNKSGGDHITESKEKQKSSESPGSGSFIDYVDIPVFSEGSRSKELKTTSVRRSMRIRNKSLPPLQRALTFTSPSH